MSSDLAAVGDRDQTAIDSLISLLTNALATHWRTCAGPGTPLALAVCSTDPNRRRPAVSHAARRSLNRLALTVISFNALCATIFALQLVAAARVLA